MQPMGPPGGYPQQPQQGYPQGQQGYPLQQQQQAYGPPQQQGYPQQQQGWSPPARQPSRSIALILIGSGSLLVSMLAFLVFAYNAYDYSNAEDNFASIPDSGWIVDMVKDADMHRMMLFGAVAVIFGLGGLVCGGFGLRKR